MYFLPVLFFISLFYVHLKKYIYIKLPFYAFPLHYLLMLLMFFIFIKHFDLPCVDRCYLINLPCLHQPAAVKVPVM